MNLSGNEQGKAIINICPTKFIFKQNSGNVDEIVDFFHLADGTKQFLTTAEPGECVMNIKTVCIYLKNICVLKIIYCPFS